jgi:hypothetical protein
MATPTKPGDLPQRSPGRSPNLPCPLPPIPGGTPQQPGGSAPPPPRAAHHRRARSEVAFRFPDDLGSGGGGSFDEIGSEDDLFSTFMDMDKIAGADRDRDRAAETSSPPRPAKHRHSASFDGFGMGGPGGQQDGAGGVFGDVMEAKKAMSSKQLAELAAIDPKRAKR